MQQGIRRGLLQACSRRIRGWMALTLNGEGRGAISLVVIVLFLFFFSCWRPVYRRAVAGSSTFTGLPARSRRGRGRQIVMSLGISVIALCAYTCLPAPACLPAAAGGIAGRRARRRRYGGFEKLPGPNGPRRNRRGFSEIGPVIFFALALSVLMRSWNLDCAPDLALSRPGGIQKHLSHRRRGGSRWKWASS